MPHSKLEFPTGLSTLGWVQVMGVGVGDDEEDTSMLEEGDATGVEDSEDGDGVATGVEDSEDDNDGVAAGVEDSVDEDGVATGVEDTASETEDELGATELESGGHGPELSSRVRVTSSIHTF